MSKHTPGPWGVDQTSIGAYGVWTAYAAQPGHDGAGYPKQICSVITGDFPLTKVGSREERDANAQLVAAADLLAACKEALATGERDMQHILDNGRLRDVLQAAIAKAEGEESK